MFQLEETGKSAAEVGRKLRKAWQEFLKLKEIDDMSYQKADIDDLKEGLKDQCDDISIGEIKRDPEISFLREKNIVQIVKHDDKQAIVLYEKYREWCYQKDLLPIGKHGFIQRLYLMGIVTAQIFETLYRTEMLSPDSLK